MSFRLAEAIRIGSKETLPICGKLLRVVAIRDDKTTLGACALGAAGLAAGLDQWYLKANVSMCSKLGEAFPELYKQVRVGTGYLYLYDIIIDMNDLQGKSREQIADWIETL